MVINHLLPGMILQVCSRKLALNRTCFNRKTDMLNKKTLSKQGNICPGSPSRLFFEWFSVKTIVLVRVYYQQILGNVMFMVFDFQGFFSLLNMESPKVQVWLAIG